MSVNPLRPGRAWPLIALSLYLGLSAPAALAASGDSASRNTAETEAPIATAAPVEIRSGGASPKMAVPPIRINKNVPGAGLSRSLHEPAGTVPGAAGSAIRDIPASSGPGLSRMPAEMNAVRGLREAKEIGEAMLGVTARENNNLLTPGGVDLTKARGGDSPFDLTPPDRGGNAGNARMPEGMPPMPDLPSNREKGPPSLVGSPSHNLSDHMGGAAGQDSGHGRVVGRESDGGVVNETGTVWSRETRLYQDGYTVTEVFSQHDDGGSTVQTIRTDVENNTVTMDVVHRDREGNVTDTDRIVMEADPHAGEDIAGMPDPNANTGDGSVCRAMPWVCRAAPARNPNRVNPGNAPGGFVPAKRIDPGDSIVVNPAVDHVRQANQARGVSRDEARRAVERGTHFNPPGPND